MHPLPLIIAAAAPAAGTQGSHWIGIVCAAAVFYIGAWYGAPTSKAPPLHREPTSSPHPPRVARSLVLGTICFFLVDAAVFHSGLYSSVLSKESYAGHVQFLVTQERQRAASTAKKVLVLGDSRIAEGFSAPEADKIAGPEWDFINGSVAGSAACVWHYLLREIDPGRNRYFAIVLPIEYRDTDPPRAFLFDGLQDNFDRTLDISLATPLLRYSDCVAFASSFTKWANQCRAFAVCVMRGFGYQSDILDLLEHPSGRLERLKQREKASLRSENYAGRPENLIGLTYDAETETITTPPNCPPPVRAMLEQSVAPPSKRGGEQYVLYRERWLGAILRRYAGSETRIVLVQLPRGPVRRAAKSPEEEKSTLPSLLVENQTVVLNENLFSELEQPEFFFDAHHPNASGRQRITEGLVRELTQRFSPQTSQKAQPSASN